MGSVFVCGGPIPPREITWIKGRPPRDTAAAPRGDRAGLPEAHIPHRPPPFRYCKIRPFRDASLPPGRLSPVFKVPPPTSGGFIGIYHNGVINPRETVPPAPDPFDAPRHVRQL